MGAGTRRTARFGIAGVALFAAVLVASVPVAPAMADTTTTTSTTTTSTTTTSTTTTSTTSTTTPPTTTAPTTTTPADPSSPIVVQAQSATATPSTGLVNLQTVVLSGSGWPANSAVGWAECKAGPVPGTQADCDVNHTGSTVTDGSGSFSVPFTVRRMLHAQSGTVDCAAAPGTCKIGVGLLANLTVFAGAGIDFDPSAPLPPPPVLLASPTTGLVDGQSIVVAGTGYVPSTPIEAYECVAGTNQCGFIGGLGAAVNASGSFLTALQVRRRITIGQWADFDCASGPDACELMVQSQYDPDHQGRLTLDFDAASPIGGPTVTVTPNAGLVNFQTVTVAGSGYDGAGEFAGVGVTVCRAGSLDDADCLQNSMFVPLDGAGTFSTQRIMRRIAHFPSGDFDCGSAPDACEIRAASFGPVSGIGSATFSFAPGPPPPPPAITVAPDTGLASHDTVTVQGTGFMPNAGVLLTQCLAGSGPSCPFAGQPVVPTADGSGTFTTTFSVRRGVASSFFPPTIVDCAGAPGTCAIVAAAFDDGDHAEATISFDPNIPVATPSVTVTPTLDLPDRQIVSIDVTGLTPDEQVFVGQCADTNVPCGAMFSPGPVLYADANGELHTTRRVLRDLPNFFQPGVVNCAAAVGTCFLRVQASSDYLAVTDVPLGFDPTAVAPGPTLVASPPGPWTEGQQVTLSGSGYTADATLGVAECTAAGNFNGSTCAKSLFDGVTTDRDGNFTTVVTITRTFESQDATIDCATIEGGCVLFAANRQDYGYERASLPLDLAGITLAFTGSSSLPVAAAGATALGLGLAILLIVRRRRTSS